MVVVTAWPNGRGERHATLALFLRPLPELGMRLSIAPSSPVPYSLLANELQDRLGYTHLTHLAG
jgi:hypothetical protein